MKVEFKTTCMYKGKYFMAGRTYTLNKDEARALNRAYEVVGNEEPDDIEEETPEEEVAEDEALTEEEAETKEMKNQKNKMLTSNDKKVSTK